MILFNLSNLTYDDHCCKENIGEDVQLPIEVSHTFILTISVEKMQQFFITVTRENLTINV